MEAPVSLEGQAPPSRTGKEQVLQGEGMNILVIEDSSKVVYGGGQRVTETVIGILDGRSEIFLVDATADSVLYDNCKDKIRGFLPVRAAGRISGARSSNNLGPFELISAPFVFATNFIPLSRWYTRIGKPPVVYCTTKKAFIYGALLKLVYGCTLIFHCHYVSPPGSALSRAFDRLVCSMSDSIIAVSGYVTRQFRCKEKIRVVYNGIDMEVPERFTRRRLGSKVRVGFVGNIIPLKGADVFFRVAEELKEDSYEFHLFGKNLSGVEVPGSVRERGFEPREVIYGSIDILLVCSKVAESFSLTSAEARLSGVPVIAPRLGAFPEVVDDGVTGLLYDSPAEINGLLRRLSDGPTYEEFSQNALEGTGAFGMDTFSKEIRAVFGVDRTG